MNETPQLRERLNQLKAEVSPSGLTSGFTPSLSGWSSWSVGNIYAIIPVVIFFILLLYRPSFVMDEKEDRKGNAVFKLSVQKLFMFWLIISSLLIIGIFGYNYKRE